MPPPSMNTTHSWMPKQRVGLQRRKEVLLSLVGGGLSKSELGNTEHLPRPKERYRKSRANESSTKLTLTVMGLEKSGIRNGSATGSLLSTSSFTVSRAVAISHEPSQLILLMLRVTGIGSQGIILWQVVMGILGGEKYFIIYNILHNMYIRECLINLPIGLILVLGN